MQTNEKTTILVYQNSFSLYSAQKEVLTFVMIVSIPSIHADQPTQPFLPAKNNFLYEDIANIDTPPPPLSSGKSMNSFSGHAQ
jgi:hypothetical protein